MPGRPSESGVRDWRVLRTGPDPGPWNMALDVALARCAPPQQAILRIYSWSAPTLSFGRNQPALGRYEDLATGELGGRVVRRPTGGREVLHDRELTYSVVAPKDCFGGPKSMYRSLNTVLVEALRSLGVEAELAQPAGPPRDPAAGLCFGAAAQDEIEIHGRKLVGSAQARFGRMILQHGSLPLAPPTAATNTFGRAGISLSEVVSDSVRFSVVAGAIETAMRRRIPGDWRHDRVRSAERRLAATLLPHYESPEWTWRR